MSADHGVLLPRVSGNQTARPFQKQADALDDLLSPFVSYFVSVHQDSRFRPEHQRQLVQLRAGKFKPQVEQQRAEVKAIIAGGQEQERRLLEIPADERDSPAAELRRQKVWDKVEALTGADRTDVVQRLLDGRDAGTLRSLLHAPGIYGELVPDHLAEEARAVVMEATVVHPGVLPELRAIREQAPIIEAALREAERFVDRAASIGSSQEASELLRELGTAKRVQGATAAASTVRTIPPQARGG